MNNCMITLRRVAKIQRAIDFYINVAFTTCYKLLWSVGVTKTPCMSTNRDTHISPSQNILPSINKGTWQAQGPISTTPF